MKSIYPIPSYLQLKQTLTKSLRFFLTASLLAGMVLTTAQTTVVHAQVSCTSTQVTNAASASAYHSDISISADGTRITFRSNADLTGSNPDLG